MHCDRRTCNWGVAVVCSIRGGACSPRAREVSPRLSEGPERAPVGIEVRDERTPTWLSFMLVVGTGQPSGSVLPGLSQGSGCNGSISILHRRLCTAMLPSCRARSPAVSRTATRQQADAADFSNEIAPCEGGYAPRKDTAWRQAAAGAFCAFLWATGTLWVLVCLTGFAAGAGVGAAVGATATAGVDVAGVVAAGACANDKPAAKVKATAMRPRRERFISRRP